VSGGSSEYVRIVEVDAEDLEVRELLYYDRAEFKDDEDAGTGAMGAFMGALKERFGKKGT
jgi:hypothetical protein